MIIVKLSMMAYFVSVLPISAMVTDGWLRSFIRSLVMTARFTTTTVWVMPRSPVGFAGIGAPNERSGADSFFKGCPIPSDSSLSLLE
jgi:hypothetical protein